MHGCLSDSGIGANGLSCYLQRVPDSDQRSKESKAVSSWLKNQVQQWWDNVNYRAFVISLERAKERFAHAATLLPQLPLEGELLPAVDGNAMSPDEVGEVYRQRQHRPIYPFELLSGEIGCFLSHRNAWRQIVERKLDAALVLEDDVCIDQDEFGDVVEFAAKICPPGAFVQLPVRPLPSNATVFACGERRRVVCPQVTPLRTSGQWVSRQAAEKLLAVTEKFDRPVDSFLQMHWITGVRLLAIEPSGLSDMTADLGGSTIGVSKSRRLTFQKLSREIYRAWYRWRIARLSSVGYR
ncbi:MAG: glycosyltransferase family 25 protein [Fuerstiella sp.]|nr:glycosyltransferase family 25 protein [Fuerstiella sp.]MCP4859020.1 glycosyltransferase family 25 protein [Fuerstiella sp.]